MKRALIFLLCQFAFTVTLCSIGGKTFCQSTSNDTLLLMAVKKNDFKSVTASVNAGANPNLVDENNATILQWATMKSDLRTVRYLVNKGANFNKKGRIYTDGTKKSYYGNLLSIAAAENKINFLTYFIEELRIPVDDLEIDPITLDTGWTALQWAANKGNIEPLKYLIGKGANVSARQYKDRNTPLHYALINNKTEAAKILIANSSNIFYLDTLRYRPLKLLSMMKLPLVDYNTLQANIDSIRRVTVNIYDVYKTSLEYLIAIDSPRLVLDFIDQYIEGMTIGKGITGAQYQSYDTLTELAYQYCGRSYNLINFYRGLQSTSPFLNITGHYDYLKSQEVHYMADLCMNDEISNVASTYFRDRFSGNWNYYSMMIFVGWITSYNTISKDANKIRPLLNSLTEFAKTDSLFMRLTKAYSDGAIRNNEPGSRNFEFKKNILGYLGPFDEFLSIYEKGGKLGPELLVQFEAKFRGIAKKTLRSVTLEMLNKMDSKNEFNKVLNDYLISLYGDNKTPRHERLSILSDLAGSLDTNAKVLLGVYQQELAIEKKMNDTVLVEEYMFMKLGKQLHQAIPKQRVDSLISGIKRYLDILKDPNSSTLNNLFFIAYDIQMSQSRNDIDLYSYYLKFRNQTDTVTRILTLTYELQIVMDKGNKRVANELIGLLQKYLRDHTIPGIDKPKNLNLDYIGSILLSYDYLHPSTEDNVREIVFLIKYFDMQDFLATKSALRSGNKAFYDNYIKVAYASLTQSCENSNRTYESLDKVIKLRIAKNNREKNAESNHLKSTSELHETAAIVDFYVYETLLDKENSNANRYICYISRKNILHPKKVVLFSKAQILELLGDSTIYEIKDIAKKQALYNLIWKPIEENVGNAKDLYLSATGILSNLPFEVIRSFGKAKDRRIYNLLNYDTGSTFDDDVVDINKTVAFGGIDYDSSSDAIDIQVNNAPKTPNLPSRGGTHSWPALKGTLSEMELLRKLSNDIAKTYEGKEATETAFRLIKDRDNTPEIIHIATHGYSFPAIDKEEVAFNGTSYDLQFFSTDESYKKAYHPLARCGLIFAGGNKTWGLNEKAEDPHDGRMTGAEISNLNLSGTKLVVLSACNTAVGDGNNNLFSIAGAFKIAGAKYVLATLWEVPDQTTKTFMELFYSHLKSGRTINTSFQEAQQQFRKMHPDPYYWGAFLLLQ